MDFDDDPHDYPDQLWRPIERHGWTWVQTMAVSPETHSLFDADGELMGEAHQRFGRVICWAPFTWAEEAYRSEEDIGEYGFEDDAQRQRHFARIGEALSGWVRRKRGEGVDIPLLRDTHTYYFETGNGHVPKTVGEFEHRGPHPPADPGPATAIDGWLAERVWGWHCEGYRLRYASGQMRGAVQVRLGVVRAVAAQPDYADGVDPMRGSNRGRATCPGPIVLQARLRPMASAFESEEREAWLRKAVEAVRATPDPDRSWPPETLGARGTERQRMFPASRRERPASGQEGNGGSAT